MWADVCFSISHVQYPNSAFPRDSQFGLRSLQAWPAHGLPLSLALELQWPSGSTTAAGGLKLPHETRTLHQPWTWKVAPMGAQRMGG